jgi:thiamine-phosphate pyrophosphorylase
MDIKIIRLIDANANRAREGLRVLEEVARMLWDDPALTERLKTARHTVTSLITSLPMGAPDLLRARDSADDVGSTSSLATEQARGSVGDILTSNCKRVEEAVRVLEEFTKLAVPVTASGFKALRFELYTLEKDLVLKYENKH